MLSMLKRTIDLIYAFLLPDQKNDFGVPFRYRLLVVALVFGAFTSAAYAAVFIQ